MRRILVVPEQLQHLSGQLRHAAGALHSLEGHLRRTGDALDWEVQFQASVQDEIAAAGTQAAMLARIGDQMARFLHAKAEAFAEADRAGVDGIEQRLSPMNKLLQILPWVVGGIPGILPVWRLGSLFGGGEFPIASDLLWFWNNKEKAPAPPPVLDTPLFKQWGQPWSNLPLAGGDWEQYGCTLTSMAMVLKQLKPSITVDRDWMKSLRDNCTKDGLVYWESPETKAFLKEHGASLTWKRAGDRENVMEQALENLQKGLPTILGVNNKSHWIVITGWKGTDAGNLRLEDFTINDPGRDRHTLADFLEGDYRGSVLDKIVTIQRA